MEGKPLWEVFREEEVRKENERRCLEEEMRKLLEVHRSLERLIAVEFGRKFPQRAYVDSEQALKALLFEER